MFDLLIFDADDTLWSTEILYDRALDAAQAAVVQSGIDGSAWRIRQREIDVAAAKTEGFSRSRFPTSSVEAYRELAGSRYEASIEQEVWKLSDGVFSMVAEIKPGVRATLAALSQDSRLALVTKGEREIQHKRVEDSQLARYFDVIAVVDRKTPQTFGGVCEILHTPPASAVSVGNSLRSDIEPAIAAGLMGVWIPAYVWEHEREQPAQTSEGISKLSDIRDLADELRQCGIEQQPAGLGRM